MGVYPTRQVGATSSLMVMGEGGGPTGGTLILPNNLFTSGSHFSLFINNIFFQNLETYFPIAVSYHASRWEKLIA